MKPEGGKLKDLLWHQRVSAYKRRHFILQKWLSLQRGNKGCFYSIHPACYVQYLQRTSLAINQRPGWRDNTHTMWMAGGSEYLLLCGSVFTALSVHISMHQASNATNRLINQHHTKQRTHFPSLTGATSISALMWWKDNLHMKGSVTFMIL